MKVQLILIITVLVLAGVILWLLYTALSAKGSVSRATERKGNTSLTKRMSAEVFVETWSSRRRQDKEEDR